MNQEVCILIKGQWEGESTGQKSSSLSNKSLTKMLDTALHNFASLVAAWSLGGHKGRWDPPPTADTSRRRPFNQQARLSWYWRHQIARQRGRKTMIRNDSYRRRRGCFCDTVGIGLSIHHYTSAIHTAPKSHDPEYIFKVSSIGSIYLRCFKSSRLKVL